MNSKILIDVNEQGIPVISIEKVSDSLVSSDVRDKLIGMFLERGDYAEIKWRGNVAQVQTLNVMDLLDSVHEYYKDLFKGSESEKEFEQAMYKVMMMLERATGIQSTKFIRKCEAQATLGI